MKKAGDILREERLRQNLSLEEISQRTKVRLDFLQLIESGEYTTLPSQVYTRGFIAAYASALGLDTDRVIPFYRRERKLVESNPANKIPQPLDRKIWRVTPGKIFMGLIAAALTVFLVVLYIQYRNYAGLPVLIVDVPADNVSTAQESIEVSGRSDLTSELTINGEKVVVGVDGSFRLPFTLNPGVNRIRIVATSKLGKKSVIERVVERTVSP